MHQTQAHASHAQGMHQACQACIRHSSDKPVLKGSNIGPNGAVCGLLEKEYERMNKISDDKCDSIVDARGRPLGSGLVLALYTKVSIATPTSPSARLSSRPPTPTWMHTRMYARTGAHARARTHARTCVHRPRLQHRLQHELSLPDRSWCQTTRTVPRRPSS